MDASPLETISPEEPDLINQVVTGVINEQNATFVPGTTARRDVHSKSHGTIDNASFVINSCVPEPARRGLFANYNRFKAEVRMSNGTPGVGSDAKPNVRGFAIKVHGVPGAKLLAGDESGTDVDFLMANHPTSFHRFVQDYPSIQDILKDGNVGLLLRRFPIEGLLLLRATLKLVKNPLTTAYFSQTPYMLGDRAVKYALVPQSRSCPFSLPNFRDPDFLRHAAENLLRRQPVRFTFCVQFQQDGDPIENPGIRWKGPLIPVAELVLPQRTTELTESSGEGLSFNPWRTLEAHKPLGWVNRVRKVVYQADFLWRSGKNGAQASGARCPFGYGVKKS